MGDPTNNAGDPVNNGLSRRRRAEDEPVGFTERPVLKQSVDTEALKRAINAHVPTKLSAAHPHDIAGLSDVTAEKLLKAVINGERGYLNLIVDQLLDNRIGMVMLYEQLLRPVSTELGELWREDKLDFVDVELATARLQMMCNRFAARFAATQNNIDPAKRIILARVRGERHMLGLSIVEVFFRHAGWVVDGGTYLETDAAFYERIRHAHYDIVGLSVGAASVDAISDTIRHIRSDSRNMNVKIALGGPAIAYDPKRFLPAGADLLSADVRTAVEKANTLIAAG